MSKSSFIWIVLVVVIPTTAESMRFDLISGTTKCITEDLKTNAMTVGKYQVLNPNQTQPVPDSYKLTVRVTSSYGNNYHYGDQVSSGNFAFTSAEGGDYIACFWAPETNPTSTVPIEFEWRTGVAAKDWSKVAKKGQIEVMEVELRKLYETVSSIHEEMFFFVRGKEKCKN